MAEVFARVMLAARRGIPSTIGRDPDLRDLADLVEASCPTPYVRAEGGREDSATTRRRSRLATEFGSSIPAGTPSVEVINDVRRQEGLTLVTGR